MLVTKNGRKMKTLDLKENPLLEVSVNSSWDPSSKSPEPLWKETKNKPKKCSNPLTFKLNKKNKSSSENIS